MNRKIKAVMEGGYQSAEFQKFCHMLGYKIELSPTRDKHAHGVAERSIENIVTKANTVMASFDHSFDDILKTEDAFNAFEYFYYGLLTLEVPTTVLSCGCTIC